MTVQPLQQLQQVSLREQALAVIRKSLVVGEIVPGEIYSAAALATKLGVSNSPVREAMLTLVQQGLMEPVRNRGFRVIPISEHDLGNIYQLRLMLEVPAMEKLAESGLVPDRQERFRVLADSIVHGAAREDLVEYLDADRQFHLGLLDLLDNPYLTEIVAGLRDKTPLTVLKALVTQDRLLASAKEHELILDALVAGDRERTRQVMTHHLEHIRGDWNSERALRG